MVYSLVLLTLLSVLAVASMDASIIEQRLRVNLRNKVATLYAGEAALVIAEAWLSERNMQFGDCDYSCAKASNAGVRDLSIDVLFNKQAVDIYDDIWWQDNAALASLDRGDSITAEFYIEQILSRWLKNDGAGSKDCLLFFYKISIRAIALNSASRILLQSDYVKSLGCEASNRVEGRLSWRQL